MLWDAWTTREKWIHRMILDLIDPVNYNNNVYKDAFLGNLYRVVRCCGASGPNDYSELFNISPPPQCIDTLRTGGVYFDEGCTKKFPFWLRLWSSIICSMLLLAALLSAVGVVLSSRLIKVFKHQSPLTNHPKHDHHHRQISQNPQKRHNEPLRPLIREEDGMPPLPPIRSSSRTHLVHFEDNLAEHSPMRVTQPLIVAEKGTQSQFTTSVTTQTYEMAPNLSEERSHVFKHSEGPRIFNYEDAKPDRPFFSSASSPTATNTSSSLSKYDSLGQRVYERIGGARVFHFPALLPRATMNRFGARNGANNNNNNNNANGNNDANSNSKGSRTNHGNNNNNDNASARKISNGIKSNKSSRDNNGNNKANANINRNDNGNNNRNVEDSKEDHRRDTTNNAISTNNGLESNDSNNVDNTHNNAKRFGNNDNDKKRGLVQVSMTSTSHTRTRTKVQVEKRKRKHVRDGKHLFETAL